MVLLEMLLVMYQIIIDLINIVTGKMDIVMFIFQ